MKYIPFGLMCLVRLKSMKRDQGWQTDKFFDKLKEEVRNNKRNKK